MYYSTVTKTYRFKSYPDYKITTYVQSKKNLKED
jgi:hypothetical protein